MNIEIRKILMSIFNREEDGTAASGDGLLLVVPIPLSTEVGLLQHRAEATNLLY